MMPREIDGHALRVVPSPNYGSRRGGLRADMLILHYTGMEDAERAVYWLCAPESEVSCHYLVDEAGGIVQMVDEAERAWHAGASCWHGETDINSCSIGIEIHNPGHELGYPDFPDAQMLAVEALVRDIMTRHAMVPERLLAHSDIAPARKIDPGEKFNWARLAAAGLGLWLPPEARHDDVGYGIGDEGPVISMLQRELRDFGYGIEVNGSFDRQTEIVVLAFQRHWRPDLVDGRWDRSTAVSLHRLLQLLGKAGPAMV